ncbi:aldose 1-epimerase family protein [Agrobacterium vitis]|uniref:aldose 1-epimerase family protein n=1 Tax=Agrobacterium vitis TaxID=373 RepID=UPI001573BDBC|nr:aldose 1-epimerase family protein [Agrobacterium vitis]NSZ48790.1 aldose 1-epimerase family protein [Agrobacterium vitis]UJL73913.1 aldose 1-epimerase family protein [Agrobacterium vitis]
MMARSSANELPSQKLSPMQLRERTVDGRGIADIRLLQMEDGPGRGQRLFVVRNAAGIAFEIAVDRGFDISSATWRGINIGWNSANGLPWPPNSVDAEDGVGFYRNLDGFVVTCGLDHIGGARRSDASHFTHKHRKEVFNPLHGRISSQRALISGYGINWDRESPVIWAEGDIRQSSVFGENLLLRRRISIDVFGSAIRINDVVENRGFRPTPHALLYHVNFGYPFLDEQTELSGDLDENFIAAFKSEDKQPRDDFVDYFQEVPIVPGAATASINVSNSALMGGMQVNIEFPRAALPDFGVWRAFQSGVYALALEPMLRRDFNDEVTAGAGTLASGETATYWLELQLSAIPL